MPQLLSDALQPFPSKRHSKYAVLIVGGARIYGKEPAERLREIYLFR